MMDEKKQTSPPEPPKTIPDRLDEIELPTLGRPLAQEDIENAIAEATTDKEAALSRDMMVEFDQDVLLRLGDHEVVARRRVHCLTLTHTLPAS